jgi:hypothetical protein
MWMWRWAQMTPRSIVRAAVGAFEGDARGAGKIAGLADRRLDAELELLGHGDLDLGFLARRAEHADVGDAPLGADQMDLLGAGELAGLGQFVFRRQLMAGAEQRFDIGLRQVHVVGRDFDRDRRVFFGLASSSSWLRSMARRVSQATRRSSSLATTRMVTGESSVEMTAQQTGELAEVAVLFLVELDAHVAEALAGQAAHRGAGFADVAGEGQHVDAAHRRDIGADVLAHLVAEGLVGEQGAVVAVGGGGLDLVDVAGDAGDALEAAFGVDQRGQLSGDILCCSIRWIITAGSMLPERLGMIRPSVGVMPIVVSTERPWSMAHSEAPMPRWQETISSSPSGRLQDFGGLQRDVAVRGAVEAVAADAVLLVEVVGQAVEVGVGRQRLVEGGVEDGDLRHVGEHLHGHADAGHVDRVVQRREDREFLDFGDDRG